MEHNTDLKPLISKIKEKKELSGLANSIIEEELKKYFGNKATLDLTKEKDKKEIIKAIRAKLRKLTGRFQHSSKERLSLVKQKDIESLLKTHSSTKERLDFYPVLKEIISSLNVSSILDLGCGLNPLALASSSQRYYASDIKEDELAIIKEYFTENKINGRVFIHDLRDFSTRLPKADLCLLFKVLDVLETKGHKLSEKLINSLDCNYLIISFPTKTLSGKPMNHPQRGWIELLLSRIGFTLVSFKSTNEIFYLASKKFNVQEIPLPR